MVFVVAAPAPIKDVPDQISARRVTAVALCIRKAPNAVIQGCVDLPPLLLGRVEQVARGAAVDLFVGRLALKPILHLPVDAVYGRILQLLLSALQLQGSFEPALFLEEFRHFGRFGVEDRGLRGVARLVGHRRLPGAFLPRRGVAGRSGVFGLRPLLGRPLLAGRSVPLRLPPPAPPGRLSDVALPGVVLRGRLRCCIALRLLRL
mmetsp:Transcript_28698/g.83026  ORF Transcript_28698/g.83026 Transcript_28698/m.83026 type:complete len:205 (-) Transcript_28698:923-1537(-)